MNNIGALKMKSFSEWLSNNSSNKHLKESITQIERILLEAKEKSEGSNQNTKGVLHELLVGYHLRGGKHMTRFKSAEQEGKETPTQAHDRLKKSVKPEVYKKYYDRAKSAANDIRNHIEKQGHKIHDVHWTSKPGDIHRSTGIHSTQKEDASDIMIHAKKGNKTHYHGISLKVTDDANKHVPVSNPGMHATYGGKSILDKHREEVSKKFPVLTKLSVEDRKAKLKSTPHMQKWVKQKNGETLHKLGKHLHDKLSKMAPHELAHHIQTHVLQSNQTPLQKAGHSHLRHTTHYSRGKVVHHSYDPHGKYGEIFKNPQHITHNVEVSHTGGAAVHFKYKGKPFASHRLKFTSQSDPLGGIKGNGQTVGD